MKPAKPSRAKAPGPGTGRMVKVPVEAPVEAVPTDCEPVQMLYE